MSHVIVKECKTYDNLQLRKAIQEAVDQLGGWSRFVKPGQTVLLKVNLIGPKRADKAATTHPEMVRAVGQLVREHGGIVRVGDSSGGAIAGMTPTRKSFTVSGIEEVAAQEGFELVNFDEGTPIEKTVPDGSGRTLFITGALGASDVVINLPKLKTHSMGFYTGAVKNMFGAIPGLRKAHYHREAPGPKEFGQVLADLHQVIPNMRLHIMDGVVAMQGEGPTSGHPYPAHRVIVSEDPLALDRIGIRMMGMDPQRITILDASVKAGIGCWDEKEISVTGNADKLKGFALPKRYHQQKKRSNPERVKGVIDFFHTVPVVDRVKCIDCNICVNSCPVHAIDRRTKEIDYELCIDCLCCHELCMVEAVELKSQRVVAQMIRNLTERFYR